MGVGKGTPRSGNAPPENVGGSERRLAQSSLCLGKPSFPGNGPNRNTNSSPSANSRTKQKDPPPEQGGGLLYRR